MIKAVLFDCDGLMFDTERISIGMWKKNAESLGVQLPEDFFAKITGSGRGEMRKYIQTVPGAEAVRKEMDKIRFRNEFWSSFPKDSLNKKGLPELFQYLAEKRYNIAICSSSPKEYVQNLMETMSVKIPYNVIVCGDMVRHAKPDPEIFLTAAKLLDVSPEECLVLEDSKQGILAAKRAGCMSCWIPDMIVPDTEMLEAIDYKCDDLLQVIDMLEKGEIQ